MLIFISICILSNLSHLCNHSERAGIRCTEDVATKQCAILRALKSKLTEGVQEADNRYANLILQLKDLEKLNKLHAEYIEQIRSSRSLMRLPTLFSEIFDLPISSKSSSSSAISDSIHDELDQHQTNDKNQTSSNSDSHPKVELNQLNQHEEQDFFFNLDSFQDSDEKIEAADLNPSLDCLDALDQLTSQ